MLDMPIRAGRRLQDAALNMRENLHRRTAERQQVNSLHRQRMTVSGSLQFTNTQDWANGMEVSPSGRFRVIEEAAPKQKLLSRNGIRWDAAWIILAAVMLVCAAILVADLAGMGIGSRNISRLDAKIADQGRRNESLNAELVYSSGDVSVMTEAVKLNMISGYGAQTVKLTVPGEISAAAVTADFRGAATGWMTTNMGD